MTTTPPIRAARGRFARGNPGGPGRPRRAVERDYLAALSEACPPEAWRAIAQRAVDDAKAGDARARSWLSDYLLGPPRPEALLELAAEEDAGRDPVAVRAHDLRQLVLIEGLL